MTQWILKSTVLAIDDEQLAEHGGLQGVRDENGLEAALSRPLNLLAYDDTPDVFDLAAGLAQRQYFNDGNKRVSAVVTELFFDLNGFALTATDQELVETWMALAVGGISERLAAVASRRAVLESITYCGRSMSQAPPQPTSGKLRRGAPARSN